MKLLQLPCGKVAKVSDEDWSRVRKLSWSDRGGGYVRARFAKRAGGDGSFVYLHRFILGAPAGIPVDHIDSDPLNNVRENLQIVTQSRNCMRSVRAKTARGIYAHRGKWRARIRIDGKSVSLGVFASADEAKQATETARTAAWANADVF